MIRLFFALCTLTAFAPSSEAQQVNVNGNNIQVFRPPTVTPGGFTTRKVGATLNVTAIGTARNVITHPGRPPQVELTINGKSTLTFPGRVVRVKGTTYKAMGWQKNHFLLFNSATRQSLYFAKMTVK